MSHATTAQMLVPPPRRAQAEPVKAAAPAPKRARSDSQRAESAPAKQQPKRAPRRATKDRTRAARATTSAPAFAAKPADADDDVWKTRSHPAFIMFERADCLGEYVSMPLANIDYAVVYFKMDYFHVVVTFTRKEEDEFQLVFSPDDFADWCTRCGHALLPDWKTLHALHTTPHNAKEETSGGSDDEEGGEGEESADEEASTSSVTNVDEAHSENGVVFVE